MKTNILQTQTIQQLSGNGPVIEVSELTKLFLKRGPLGRKTEQWALKGISFQVKRGEIYGLLGPNGSGKSTLIRILSTIMTSEGGEVRIMGKRLPQEERWVRCHIGRVSVDAAFYKKLSARENLLYAARLYGLDPKETQVKAQEIFTRLGLESKRFNDPLEEMSRGMQQKVSIARALLIDPPLLLLDEPTTGLDPNSRREVQAYLAGLREAQGTTILLTTHDMAEAERLCDRIGFLAQGRLVAEGTAAELRARAGIDNLEEAFIQLTGVKFEEADGEK
jgi:ABC-2 type transport system ATP-binding protein